MADEGGRRRSRRRRGSDEQDDAGLYAPLPKDDGAWLEALREDEGAEGMPAPADALADQVEALEAALEEQRSLAQVLADRVDLMEKALADLVGVTERLSTKVAEQPAPSPVVPDPVPGAAPPSASAPGPATVKEALAVLREQARASASKLSAEVARRRSGR